MEVGEKPTPLVTPFVQVYVNAPVAVKVTVLPKHVWLVLLVTAKVGIPPLTLMLMLAVAGQPLEVVPLSE